MRNPALWLALALASLTALGCGSTPAAFGSKFPDNRDSDVDLLLQRINAAPPRKAGSIAVGVTPSPVKVYGFDLAARRQLWQTPLAATSAPLLAGDVVVIEAGDAIVGLDLRDGAQRFAIARGAMSLKGADGNGPLVAVVLGQGQGTFAKSETLLIDGGSIRWRRPAEGMAGVPAVVGDMVLVPWNTQFLSALDAQSGKEFARVRVRDGVISHALRRDSDVYIGSFHGITRVTSSLGSGTLKGAGYFSLPEQELPGRPLLLNDVYTTASSPAPDSAQHRIALAFRAVPIDRVRIGLAHDNLYLVFYRFVFALAPKDESVRWVYVHDKDIVGAAASDTGVTLADETGRFAFLGAGSGTPAWQSERGPLSNVVAVPDGSVSDDAGPVMDANALPARLMTAAQDQDARLVPARLMAVRTLASLPQDDATADLIELCDSPRLAPAVRERACVEIRQRTIGAEHLLAILERHYGFLEGTNAPPVGALAKAAASLKEKRAAGALIAHLKDPNTPSRDLPALVTALGELGDASAAEPLGGFLRQYHADPIDEHLVHALEIVPDALVKLSGPVAKPVLESVTYDEAGTLSVRQKARVALDVLTEQEAAAERQDQAQQQAQEEQVSAEVQQEADQGANALANSLTLDMVSQALLPVRDQLIGCLTSVKPQQFQARVLLAIEDGNVLSVSVLPATLQGCIEPLIKAQKLPRTKSAKREQFTYTFKR